jgi:hypothetical protein
LGLHVFFRQLSVLGNPNEVAQGLYRLKTITDSDCDFLTFEITFVAVLCQRLLNPTTLEIALFRILDRAGVCPADSGTPRKLNSRPN